MTGRSPLIMSDSWGVLEVGGVIYKDAKLWPGGARAWDWTETGTSHRPGTSVVDVEEVMAAGAQVVILSTGRNGRLGVQQETVRHLRAGGVQVEVLATGPAIARYNELAGRGEAVGGVIHSTC